MTSTLRSLAFLPAIIACVACSGHSEPNIRIPSRDGPLVIDVRYPDSGTRVPRVDSVATWGTVGTGRATLTVNGAEVVVEANGTFAAFLPVPSGPDPALRFVARRGGESQAHTVVLDRGTRAPAVPPAAAAAPATDAQPTPWSRWVTMRRLPSDTADSATQWRPIYARWRPGGEVALGIPQGIRLPADSRTREWLRLQLAPDERVWIPIVDADTLDVATAAPALPLRAGPPAIVYRDGEALISISLPTRLPTTVELSGDRLLWTVFGADWKARPAAQPGEGTTIRRVVPRDSAPGRLVVDLGLVAMPLGWRTEWQAGTLTLRVRLRTAPSQSLQGLQVTLDPGHPPDGTTGPSGLMEDSVTLAVAEEAARQLRARGAIASLTRTTRDPRSLEARAVIAEQSPAQLFISLHLNAPGPGRPPSAVYGTQTYWMNPNGRFLARLLLEEVAKAMQQPAIGTYQGEFAVLRPAWATAALVEGSGIVLPEREAFLRTQAGVAAYAEGVVRGIERWQRMSASRALPVHRR